MNKTKTDGLSIPVDQQLDPEVIAFRERFDERSPLDELIHEGARRMLQSAIDAEVELFISQHEAKTQRIDFHQPTQRDEEFVDPVRRMSGHSRSSVGDRLDKPLMLQLNQRFSNRSAAHLVASDNIFLTERSAFLI